MNVKTATGSRNMNVPAAICPHSTPDVPILLANEGGAVRALRVVITNEKANSFHAVIRQKTAVAAMPVTA